MSTVASDFYVIGGTLQRDAPSYVKRQADDKLYNGLSAGQFCYVLTSRQMGKSSLMVRTSVRLRADDVAVVVLDLTAIGQNVTAEQWYEGLLDLIGQQLNLEEELEKFWLANKRIGPLQRWMRAIREVVMKHKRGRIVIFVDEIDAVRSLTFSTDEFFAGVREFYNWRSEDDDLMRLTFCLLGVATPSDLIRDTRTTPFNIGQRIELTDFTETEAAPLAQGLGRDERLSRLLLERALYWTGGHPYLTQRLCQSVAADDSVQDSQGVDRLCKEIFLSSRARERDDNLLFVRERMLRSEEADRASLLDLYQQVWKRRRVPDDETNTIVSVLRLSGITRAVEGFLHVRNRIYYSVFDHKWITANMPDAELRRQRSAYRKGVWRAAAIAAIILTLMGVLVAAAIQQRNVAREERRRADENADQLSVALAKAEEQRREAERQRQIAEDKSNEANQQRKIAEDKSNEAAANAKRAEIALRAAEEQRVIAERNLQAAKSAKELAEANEEAAKESERRLRKRSIDNNNFIYYLAAILKQISPTKEGPYWNNIMGNAQMHLRNYEDAISYYSGSLTDEPNNIVGLINRSYMYMVNKQPDKTVEDAKAALDINSNSASARLNLSVGLSFLGRYDEAEVNMKKGIQNFIYSGVGDTLQSYVSPEIERVTGRTVIDVDGSAALTAFYYELANMRASAGGAGFEASLIAADSRPKNVNAYLFALNWAWMNYEQRRQDFGALAAQGALWERAGYIEQALDAYNNFLKQLKEHPAEQRYDSLARWVSLRVKALRKNVLSKHQPEQLDAQDLFLRGRESRFSGRSDTLKLWTQAIEKDRSNVGYLIARAGLRYERNDFVGTRLDSNAVLSLAPNTATAYLYRALANVSDDLKAPKEVIIEDIKRAKELDPTAVPSADDNNLNKLSEILAENDLNDAIDLLERTTKYSDPSPSPYLLMARLLNGRKRYEKALEKIKIATMLRGNETELYNERRKAEEGLCQKKEVKNGSCLNQVEIALNQASAYKGFGDALLRQGRKGEALNIYVKSLRLLNDLLNNLADVKTRPEIQRDISIILSTTARVIEEQGTKAKAIEYLETELGEMNNLKLYLSDEIKRLSNSP
ncbi:MAG: hypothetical protein QOH25_1781 [Acidobacteriota bacterium]|jgi:hypothetical protein|nr:hypothetical protein [Acidobacteriota bacterium]